MRFLGKRLKLGLRQAGVGHVERDRQPETALLSRADGDGAFDVAFVASFLCCLATKSSAPPKHAA